MKKPGILNKITIIDILIIICIIGAVGFAIYHMVDDDSTKASATSFDYSTNNKMLETYLNYYKDGKIVTSSLIGTKSNTGEKIEMNGTVLWLGDNQNDKVNIEINNDGKPILAGFYKDTPNADVFIEQISLETNGDSYANITDFVVSPKEIKNLKEIISKIPNDTEYEISTTIAIDELDSVTAQKLANALNKNKKPCIVLKNSGTVILEVNRANQTDFEIADNVLGDFKGQTSEIQIRIYNSTAQDSIDIQNAFNVLSIANTSH